MFAEPVMTVQDVINAINEILETELDREVESILRGELSTEDLHTKRGRAQAIRDVQRRIKSQFKA